MTTRPDSINGERFSTGEPLVFRCVSGYASLLPILFREIRSVKVSYGIRWPRSVMNMTGDERREKAGCEQVELLAAEDQETFAERFVACWPHLLKLCQRMLGESDGARDAVSETYLRSLRGRVGFDGNNFQGWLSRIAQHVCIDRRRNEFVRQGLATGIEPAVPDSEVRILNALQVRSILAGLPEAQRRCLKLFYIEGFTAKEVAKTTGFADKQVKSHLQNGRRNFIREWKALTKNRHD